MRDTILEQIFDINSEEQFNEIALKVFRYQYDNNHTYHKYVDLLKIDVNSINMVKDIPFLPVSFFKTHSIKSGEFIANKTFKSSGTTGQERSCHHIKDLNVYQTSFLKSFYHFYGNIEDYVVLALLPSYQENENSSLIYMVDDFINRSKHPESGYFKNKSDDLRIVLDNLKSNKKKVLLIGVSYALLDFIENNKFALNDLFIVMETGGMKGRRKELIRDELHSMLRDGFGLSAIHSEYGMSELLSQAYSKENGIFESPPWMRILIRDTSDPLYIYEKHSRTGGVNIIDLANLDSCSFISTQDLGKINSDLSFEILGRFDNSDVRGCNLLMA